MKIDVIILSLVVDFESFQTTKNCIDSYINTGNKLINKIFVIETNKQFDTLGLSYNQPKVSVIIPDEKEFNYNRYFNIGLKHCTSQYVMGPNNDVIIEPNCIQNLISAFKQNPDVDSLSPVDRSWHMHSYDNFPSDNGLYIGYDISQHVMGSCLIINREKVFSTIGYLDERFFFYYQDNDYACCLRANNILHGLVTNAHFKHAISSSKSKCSDYKFLPYSMIDQQQIFTDKWLNPPYSLGQYVPFKQFP